MFSSQLFKSQVNGVTFDGASGGKKEGVSRIYPAVLKGLLCLAMVCIWSAIAVRLLHASGSEKQLPPATEEEEKAFQAQQLSLEKDIHKLNNKLEAYTPASAYLVVNTRENDFRLYKNKELIREGKCSTGSYIMLQ